jgi:hypothetical protein
VRVFVCAGRICLLFPCVTGTLNHAETTGSEKADIR